MQGRHFPFPHPHSWPGILFCDLFVETEFSSLIQGGLELTVAQDGFKLSKPFCLSAAQTGQSYSNPLEPPTNLLRVLKAEIEDMHMYSTQPTINFNTSHLRSLSKCSLVIRSVCGSNWDFCVSRMFPLKGRRWSPKSPVYVHRDLTTDTDESFVCRCTAPEVKRICFDI